MGAAPTRFPLPETNGQNKEKRMYLNRMTLIGFIGNDAERKAANATNIAIFSLATKTSWKNDAGSWESRTEWHRCVTFGKLAEFAGTLTATTNAPQVARHTPLCNDKTELLKLSVDLGGSPIPVLLRQSLDQSLNLAADLWPPTAWSGSPPPIKTEADAVPADHGVGLDDIESGPSRHA